MDPYARIESAKAKLNVADNLEQRSREQFEQGDAVGALETSRRSLFLAMDGMEDVIKSGLLTEEEEVQVAVRLKEMLREYGFEV